MELKTNESSHTEERKDMRNASKVEVTELGTYFCQGEQEYIKGTNSYYKHKFIQNDKYLPKTHVHNVLQ